MGLLSLSANEGIPFGMTEVLNIIVAILRQFDFGSGHSSIRFGEPVPYFMDILTSGRRP